MSTVSDRTGVKPPGPPDGADPFRFGWRYVPIVRPDGTEDLDQVPLTLGDVLHPEVGDVIPESDPHNGDRGYLKAVSKRRRLHDPTAVVLSDCQVDFNIRGVKPLCPDLAVFFAVRRRIAWSSFNVAEEGARPELVLEVTSPETRSNDIEIKVQYYRRAGVAWYVIADVTIEKGAERRIDFIVYHLRGRRYHRVAPNEQGRVWLEPVNLWLGQTRDAQGGFMRLACYDPETGAEVGDYTAISQALAEAHDRIDEKFRAREQAEEQARSETEAREQAEVAREQAEVAREQAEVAREQAEQRAVAEAQSREPAEATVRELQAQLERLRRPES